MITAVRSAAFARVLQLLVAAVSLAFVRHHETPWTHLVAVDDISRAGLSLQLRGGAAVEERALKPEQLFDVPAEDVHTHDKSWGKTFAEMAAGWLCFFMSICLLWLNEGHAVRMDKLFALAARKMKVVPPKPVDPENLRELVFTTGETLTTDTLEISAWAGLQAPAGSAKLRAKLWMYQWVEEEKDEDRSTTYTYKTEWMQSQVISSNFQHQLGHENPQAPQPFDSLELAATSLGGFTLSKRMLGKLQAWKPCELGGKLEEFQAIPGLGSYKKGELTTHEGKEAVFFGLSGTAANPVVGDLVACFEYVTCGPTSVLGVQVPHERAAAPWTMAPLQYVTHHSYAPLARANTATTNLGDSRHETLLGEMEADEYAEEEHNVIENLKRGVEAFVSGFPSPWGMADAFMTAACPDSVLVVVEEEVSPKEAIARERSFERMLTVTMRLFGFILMYVAAEMIFSPLKRVLSYLWIFGSILAIGIHFFTCMCTLSCGTCTVASAYVAYRPAFAMMMFAAALGVWYVAAQLSSSPGSFHPQTVG